MIKEFQGDFRWLSNFAPVDIRVGNRNFSSVEHAYMSMKSNDRDWKEVCSSGGFTPGQIKRKSKKIKLREDWEDIKLLVMEQLVRSKFNKQPFKDKLISTGNTIIQEGNRWGDTFWGVDLHTGDGENNLGRIIMKIREELTNDTTK